VRTLIRFNGSGRHVPESELVSNVRWKLIRALPRFDASRGSAFSFVSHVAMNEIRSAVTKARVVASRFVELDEVTIGRLSTNGDAQIQHTLDDIADRLRRKVKTTLCDPSEVGMQKWYVESFIHGGFELRRHQCANAGVRVFGLSHSRSRELYDLCMLECRRVLYNELKRHKPIVAGRLLGTRAQWMAHLLSPDEFTKFTVLVRNLSPFVLLLTAPQARSRRQDRNPTITRENLLWVINGHPGARPLFEP
jgi:hypothetical protein